MNHATLNHSKVNHLESILTRRSIESCEAEVLADIYEENVNIATWQRTLSSELLSAAQHILSSNHSFRVSTSVSPQDTFDSLYETLGNDAHARAISNDITEIVSMFCCLFDLERVGLRLATLERAMCPKFHVDRVPCRLVTTYSGIATQWLPHQDVNREKLGTGSQGKRDEESGLYISQSDIQQLKAGDVALLKGESWLGNEGAGLVHRSPSVTDGEKRLLLTLDFSN